MNTMLVWLLVMSGQVSGGSLAHVTPFMYPTMADCQQVAKNLPPGRYSSDVSARCVQTTVVKP